MVLKTQSSAPPPLFCPTSMVFRFTRTFLLLSFLGCQRSPLQPIPTATSANPELNGPRQSKPRQFADTSPSGRNPSPRELESPSQDGSKAQPQSIILVIVDGGGIGPYSAAYYAAPKDNRTRDFPFSRFSHLCLMTSDSLPYPTITDSAASATAFATGQKTINGAIGVNQRGEKLLSALEFAHQVGWSTGIVATASLAHATPAAFSAHVTTRENRHEIARQMTEQSIDVALGGGKRDFSSFIPTMLSSGIQVIQNLEQKVDINRPIWGFFASDGLARASQRSISTKGMTSAALTWLEQKQRPYFLLVEESQVDWAGHVNDSKWLLEEMQSFVVLINFLLDYQSKHPEVLLLVGSDHETGGAALTGLQDNYTEVSYIQTEHSADLVPLWMVGPGWEEFGTICDNAKVGQQIHRWLKSSANDKK